MNDVQQAPEPETRCAECGAPPKPPESSEAAEPVTHCEWCGAEYPLPSEG